MEEDALSFCGGSVIDDRHILTAAHCFVRRRDFAKMRILLGKTDLDQGETSAQTHRIDRVFEHPDFNVDRFENDVAILRTADKIYFNAYVIPICLPEIVEENIEPVYGFVSGWGIKKVMEDTQTAITSNTLRVARVPVIPKDECRKRWGDYREEGDHGGGRIRKIIDETTVCAGGGKVDSCQGDSGGPLVTVNGRGRYEQIGVVSWGVPASKCGIDGTPPGVYAKMNSHASWVRSKLRTDVTTSASSSAIRCNHDQFQCPNGWCISKERLCDGHEDCKGGQDEIGCAQPESACGTRSRYLDVDGGIPKVYVENPWMVLIYEEYDQYYPRCGGVIIDALHVLTSEQCIFDGANPADYLIRHGSHLDAGDGGRAIARWEARVESFIKKEAFLIMRMRRLVKFDNYLRPICVEDNNNGNGQTNVSVVGWKWGNDWDPLTSSPAYLENCESNWRFVGTHCADQCRKNLDCPLYGSHKIGDILATTTENGKVYLYGIVNSENHFSETSFSYEPLTPAMAKRLRTELAISSPTFCDENQFRCANDGICLDKSRVCDGKSDCKDGKDELLCQPPVLPQCVSASCLNGGSCVEETKTSMVTVCHCPVGYDGDNCQFNGGSCMEERRTSTVPICHCTSGYAGDRCQFNVDVCANVSCNYGSLCRDGIDGRHCLCPAGLAGENCEIEIDECASGPCQNGGVCLDGRNSFTCDCEGTWYKGAKCEERKTVCEFLKPCQNGGQCVVDVTGDVNSYSCDCLAGYAGKVCEINVDDCEPNPCRNGGTCRDHVDEFSCECPEGYEGKLCDVNIDDCVNQACYNGGKCVDRVAGWACQCPKSHVGRRL